MRPERFLCIPDLQAPFQHGSSLEFLKAIAKEYRVGKDGILCVGDEADQNYAGMYDADPDADLTANREISECIEFFKLLQDAFPRMRIAISNHMLRWNKKAAKAGIPSRVVRDMRELYQLPETWAWQDRWLIESTRSNFVLTHGMEYGGANPLWAALQYERTSVVFGHHHSVAGVQYLSKLGDATKTFAACGGSLIDAKRYAFKYGRFAKRQPILGVTVVLDGGVRAEFIPLL